MNNQFKPIEVNIEGGFDVPFPKMVKVKQKFNRTKIKDIEQSIQDQFLLENIKGKVKPGEKIAIAVGSRGIANLNKIVKEVIVELKKLGAIPFIVPAMGSHGGATAEGQTEVLSQYGITEETMDVPIKSSMEVVQIATLPSGLPVFIDKYAYSADGIVLIARIKPHTDFKGEYESGLMKMLAIGLGKHKGATTLHAQGFERFKELIPEVGKSILGHASVRMGISIIENGYDETADIIVVPSEEMYHAEPELLKKAKSFMPGILLDHIDVLIVEEIGKDISGSGMDPNITGRNSSGVPGFNAPSIQKIVVLALTNKSHGNAAGIGLADITTIKLANQIDFSSTYANCITATILNPGKIPIMMNTEKQAIALALKCCNRISIPNAKVVRIKNTLDIEDIYVSEAYIPELKDKEDIEIVGEPENLVFDKDENLI